MKEKKAMKRITFTAITFGMMAIITAVAISQSTITAQVPPVDPVGFGIAGTWDMQVGPVDCTTGAPLAPPGGRPSLASYAQGGTFIEESSGTPPSRRYPGLGVWRHVVARSYALAFKIFQYNIAAIVASRSEPNRTANASSLVAVFDQPGALSVWGDDSAHQITDAPTGEFKAVAKGGAFQGLAIRSDGTLALWGGYNDPFAIPPVPAAIAGDEFVSVAIGRSHALAIRPDGSIVGWGNNSSGQLNAPTDVRFDAVTAGNSHSIGLAEDGTLYGWGFNGFGQTNVPAGRFTEIAARAQYSLALRDDGTLFGWGSNFAGIFNTWASDGQGHFYVPDKKFKGIAAGNFHALAINVDKTVEAWGNNSTGQLNVPAGVRFKEVGGGFGYSVGITVNGRLVAWGDNSLGQLNVPDGKFDTLAAVAFHAEAIAH
jgi:hypothetical protein